MTFGEFMAHRDKLHRARGVLHLKIHPEEQSPPEPPGTQCDENEDWSRRSARVWIYRRCVPARQM